MVTVSTDPAAFNAEIVEEFRATGGHVSGPLADTPLILVHHIGARSGVERVVPLAYLLRPDGRYMIVASDGGSPRHPAWYYNLKANPTVTVEVGAESFLRPCAGEPPGRIGTARRAARGGACGEAGHGSAPYGRRQRTETGRERSADGRPRTAVAGGPENGGRAAAPETPASRQSATAPSSSVICGRAGVAAPVPGRSRAEMPSRGVHLVNAPS